MLVNMEYIKDNLRGDKDLADHIAAALDAGKQAKNLVLQLHNFSRQTCTTHCPVRVGAVVKETLELFKVSLLPSITIKTDILSDAIIMADPDLMQKILLNLIANAEYAMRSKGGTIGIKLEEVELDATSLPVSKGMKKGTCLKLTVRDNGPGISAEALKHIFEPPFTTAKRMDMDNAYGIGFNTVYDIVESHGGLITVDSEIDKGSTFEILLPIYEHIQDAQEKPIVRLTGGTERILLVDDEKDFTVISQELLQPLGYKVTTKTDSREALRFFQENPDQFDLVITDMLMPDVSGDQLAKEIFVLRPKLPIILCTGFSLFNMKEEAAAIGIRAIVRKPVILAELVGTIRKVLDERMV
jgi:CheY-like chemotaxis protein